ncbi:MAG: hypothetical protein SFV19_04345 [Rhodospirillaceae bacterium]|nr:hypothetical protein [Rhodospirillaceae bacterium]
MFNPITFDAAQRISRGGLTTTIAYIDTVYEKRACLGEADEYVHTIRAGT